MITKGTSPKQDAWHNASVEICKHYEIGRIWNPRKEIQQY